MVQPGFFAVIREPAVGPSDAQRENQEEVAVERCGGGSVGPWVVQDHRFGAVLDDAGEFAEIPERLLDAVLEGEVEAIIDKRTTRKKKKGGGWRL